MFEALHPMTPQLAGDDELYDKAKRLSDHYNMEHSNNVSRTTPIIQGLF